MSLLKEINEGKARGLTYDQLKVGEEYRFKDEDGNWFKAKVTKIEPSRDASVDDVAIVHYVYSDDHYSKKGKSDAFEVSMNDDVFMKESLNEASQDKDQMIMNTLMSARFGDWFEKDFMDFVEGESDSKSTEEILDDIKEMFRV